MEVDVLGRRELPAVLAEWHRLHSSRSTSRAA
jgi:hypothetical protein